MGSILEYAHNNKGGDEGNGNWFDLDLENFRSGLGI